LALQCNLLDAEKEEVRQIGIIQGILTWIATLLTPKSMKKHLL
jgi:hypothetical protein